MSEGERGHTVLGSSGTCAPPPRASACPTSKAIAKLAASTARSIALPYRPNY